MVQKNSINNKVIVIVGPTASGKTSLAIEIAKLLDSEIISADSMNVYKGLDIGTAKPTIEEMQGVKHHLIDVVSPFESFSVGDYKEKAKPILDNLINEGKIPIICGGTGFYVNSLLFEMSYGNVPADLETRNKYMDLAKKYGNQYVFSILQEKDYETSLKLHPNDLKRVVRALEICENGVKKSQLNDILTPLYDYQAFSFDFDRSLLYQRIEKRVDVMIENGLIDEVKSLVDLGVNHSHQCMQGIGYKEIYDYINNKTSLEDAISLLKQNTRRYAKRQITFFKKLPNLTLLKPENVKDVAKRIVENL